MESVNFYNIINSLNFSQRIISQYINTLCKELIAGTNKENTAKLVQTLSKDLKEVKEKTSQLKELFENKAHEFLIDRAYTNSLLKSVLKKDKNSKWTYQKRLMYPNFEAKTIKDSIIFVDAILLMNKENQTALRKVEKETLALLRSNSFVVATDTLPLLNLYKKFSENEHLFFVEIDKHVEDDGLFWLSGKYNPTKGKIKVTSSLPSRYETSFNSIVNLEFDEFFQDKKGILNTYHELAEKFLELAGDIANEDNSKILKRDA